MAARDEGGRGARAEVEALEGRVLLASSEGPYISEFMAANSSGLVDRYGQRSDWIEIHNPTSSPVNLAGWHLTDDKLDLDRWTFPAVTVGAGQRLTVFASGQDDAVAGQELHTDFSLRAEGEFLALVKPDGATLASVFDPYPAQTPDVSYGHAPVSNPPTPLLSSGAPGRVRVPTNGTLGTAWTGGAFDDSGWSAATTAIGFQTPGGSGSLPSEFEPNDTTATANGAEYNFAAHPGGRYHLSFTGSFGTTLDWFNIGAMQGGDVITLTAAGMGSGRGTMAGMTLELVRSNGTTVATDTSSGPGNDSLIHRFTVSAADTYYVKLSRVGSNTGNYTVSAMLENAGTTPQTGGTFNVEVDSGAGNNTLATANNAGNSWRAVQYRSVTSGQIASPGDVDVYRVTLAAGDLVSMVADSTSALDARLTLRDSAGSTVAFEDGTSGATGVVILDSSVHAYRVAVAGVYYLEVRSSNGTTGAYAVETLLSSAVTPPSPASFGPLIRTDVRAAMRGVGSSAYLRLPFSAADLTAAERLTLRVRYDDGFAAYLNGTLVASANAPASPVWSSTALGARADEQAAVFEEFDVTAFRGALVEGENVLAVHGMNVSAADNDFLLDAELYGSASDLGPLQYMASPTPGAANIAGTLGFVADTKFSIDRGFFSSPVDVAIATPTQGAQIRYTLDGSRPTETSPLYTGPIRLATTTVLRAAAFKAGFIPSNIDTHSYFFLHDVIRQPDYPAGFPSQWINRNNQVVPGSQGSDYGMDPEVVDDPAYAGRIIESLKAVPTLSIVMSVDDLFGNGSSGTNGVQGIYTNPLAKDVDNAVNPVWERATSVELIYPDGTDGFQIDAGVQIQGGASREPEKSAKHSLRLLFKNEYGAGKLEFPFFGGGGADEFDAIILKAGFNNSWMHHNTIGTSVGGQRERALYVHDQWASATQLAMSGFAKRDNYVHLYLNGLYWGLYSPQERPEASWAASYFGGAEEDYDAITANDQDVPVAVDGNITAWNTMFSIANRATGDARHISTSAGYSDLKQYLDVPSFIDWMMLNLYGGNGDWDSHNWYAVRRSRVNGVPVNTDGFKFISFDAERMLEGTNDNRLGINFANKGTRLFQQLRLNAEFRLEFADRVHRHLFNDGALTPQAVRDRLLSLLEQVDEAVIAESARWGDYRRDNHPSGTPTPIPLYTRDVHWAAEKQRVINQYVPVRSANLLNQFRGAGLYPQVDAPEFNVLGGEVSAAFALTMSNASAGVVYYTLDGTDPRLAGGAVNPAAQVYSAGVALSGSPLVRARVFHPGSGSWSALTEARFFVGPAPALRITEIMYNPDRPPGSAFLGSDFEFVEIHNAGTVPVQLAGVRLETVADFTFPAMILQPDQRTVIVSNLEAFRFMYGPSVSVAGQYAGRLNGNGETLTLRTAAGQLIQRVEYEDDWYSLTDGEGFSLVAVYRDVPPPQHEGKKEAWRTSASHSGGPGAADPGLNGNAVVISEVMASTSSAGGAWFELRNTTGADIDVGGWLVSDANDGVVDWVISAGTVIEAGKYAVFLAAEDFGAALSFSPAGGKLILRSIDAQGAPGGYRDVVDYGVSDTDVSLGRHVKGDLGSDFTAMSAATPGAGNSPPRAAAVVINEVMYNPEDGGDEFIEVRNVSGGTVSLHDGVNGWAFVDGVGFTFPAGASIAPGGVALVVAGDPAAFRAAHDVDPSVAVFGPYTGVLRDNGENLAVGRPVSTMDGIAYVVVDRVNYDNAQEWPSLPDGNGPSLQRAGTPGYGNDAANWRPGPAGGTPGAANIAVAAPVITLPAAVTINEGANLNVGGSFTDLDAGESWTATVDWGDGTPAAALALSGGKTFTLNRGFPDQGVYTVTVTIRDSRGLFARQQLRVTVNSAPPAAVVNAPAVTEGAASGSVTLSSASDPASADRTVGFRYHLDTDGDGDFDVLGASAPAIAFTAAELADGPLAWSVRIRMLDKDGHFADYAATLAVSNSPPAVSVQPGFSSVIGIGMPFSSLGFFSDPGADTWTGTVDYGDGSGPQPLTLGADKTFAVNRTFNASGNYNILVRVTDSDGAVGQVSIPVTVRGPVLLGTAGEDEHALRLSADGQRVEFFENAPLVGPPTFSVPVGMVASVAFDGAGGDDRVAIDYSNGDPLGSASLALGGGSVTVDSVGTPAAGLRLRAEESADVRLAATLKVRSLMVGGAGRVHFDAPRLELLELVLEEEGRLEVGAGSLLLRVEPGERDAVLADVTAWIASGRAGGLWNGPGIISSAAAGNPLTTLGVVATAEGVLVKHTYNGDADLSGRVDVLDYFAIDAGKAQRRSGFASGDFDFSGGHANADDYMLIDRAFLGQGEGLVGSIPAAVGPAVVTSQDDGEDEEDRGDGAWGAAQGLLE